MTDQIHVLLGDDDLYLTEAIVSFLESHDYKVTTAATAADVFIAAVDDNPDIILSDFDYGIGRSDRFADGLAIGLALRAQGVEIPFIIHSGLDRPEAVEAGFETWEKGNIAKLPEKIAAAVRKKT